MSQWTVALAMLALAAAAACVPSTNEPSTVVVTGVVYTDEVVDRPCDQEDVYDDLARVELTFSSAAGVLGVTRSGPVESQPLTPGPGAQGQLDGGCRYMSPYSIRLPLSGAYAVRFETLEPGNDPGTGFIGTHELTSETTTIEALAANDFVWDFEAPAAFVVP